MRPDAETTRILAQAHLRGLASFDLLSAFADKGY